jgi:DNA-directed RNA polymerase specialized sigma24 family protein
MEMLEDRQTRGFAPAAGRELGLEKRISFLPDADQRLLKLSLRGAVTRREAAALLGMSPGTVSRRLKRLMDRLNDPLVVALVDQGQLLPEGYREVGLGYFLRRMSEEEIARATGLSMWEVRRALSYVRGWHGTGDGRDRYKHRKKRKVRV